MTANWPSLVLNTINFTYYNHKNQRNLKRLVTMYISFENYWTNPKNTVSRILNGEFLYVPADIL